MARRRPARSPTRSWRRRRRPQPARRQPPRPARHRHRRRRTLRRRSRASRPGHNRSPGAPAVGIHAHSCSSSSITRRPSVWCCERVCMGAGGGSPSPPCAATGAPTASGSPAAGPARCPRPPRADPRRASRQGSVDHAQDADAHRPFSLHHADPAPSLSRPDACTRVIAVRSHELGRADVPDRIPALPSAPVTNPVSPDRRSPKGGFQARGMDRPAWTSDAAEHVLRCRRCTPPAAWPQKATEPAGGTTAVRIITRCLLNIGASADERAMRRPAGITNAASAMHPNEG